MVSTWRPGCRDQKWVSGIEKNRLSVVTVIRLIRPADTCALSTNARVRVRTRSYLSTFSYKALVRPYQRYAPAWYIPQGNPKSALFFYIKIKKSKLHSQPRTKKLLIIYCWLFLVDCSLTTIYNN